VNALAGDKSRHPRSSPPLLPLRLERQALH
jgi:hypothetical protein